MSFWSHFASAKLHNLLIFSGERNTGLEPATLGLGSFGTMSETPVTKGFLRSYLFLLYYLLY